MSFLRQYVAPLFIFLIFLVAMVAVSARIFLPSDLAAPAPIEDPNALQSIRMNQVAETMPAETIFAQFYAVPPTSANQKAQHG